MINPRKESITINPCPQCGREMLPGAGYGALCTNCGYPRPESIHQWETSKQLDRIEKKLDDLLKERKV